MREAEDLVSAKTTQMNTQTDMLERKIEDMRILEEKIHELEKTNQELRDSQEESSSDSELDQQLMRVE